MISVTDRVLTGSFQFGSLVRGYPIRLDMCTTIIATMPRWKVATGVPLAKATTRVYLRTRRSIYVDITHNRPIPDF